MTEPSAKAFLREAAAAFPFRLTHMLIDHGSCFTTGALSEDCSALDAQHRTTKPYTPQADGWPSASIAALSVRCRPSPWSRTATFALRTRNPWIARMRQSSTPTSAY